MPAFEPRPKPKVSTKITTLGLYGMFGSMRSDFWKIASALYHSKFTGAVTFLKGSFTQVPLSKPPKPLDKKEDYHPWKRNAQGVYDMTQDDPTYYARLDDMLAAFEYYGLDLVLCFEDVYYLNQWILRQDFKFNPYLKNTFGVNYSKEQNAQPIFDGVRPPGQPNFWLNWESVSEIQNKYLFHPANQFGVSLIHWITTVMTKVKAARAASTNKAWRILYKPHNEEFGKIGPSGKTEHGISLGDRSEIEAWFHDQWKAKGLEPDGKTFLSIINRDILGGTIDQRIKPYHTIHKDITGPYGKAFGLGSLHETHIDTVDNLKWERDECGFDLSKTFVSNDGMPKNSAAQFTNDSRELYHFPGVINFDQLYEEGGLPGHPNLWGVKDIHAPWDYQWNFDRVFPFHAAIVK